ncbi:MAG: DNA-3-methyladenine glycosylase I [Parvularculaceae bacterium]|jgi:DNA-3-methyladenine glycosylase I|nr:DNA-3-methyladenine glycosylase I [Parvularculaceae bacterium]
MAKPEASLPCPWAPADDALYRQYHDEEWGVPERDHRALFEKLVLDGFQAGLSWRTILHKRAAFRRAFDGFEPAKIARYTPKKIEKLLADDGIIRSRSKIEATIGNARAYLDVMETRTDGFSGFLWEFVGGAPIVNRVTNYRLVAPKTKESEAMAKELRRLGFKFCGPVIVYAFMQAVGMVNDHEVTCPRHKAVQKL